MNGKADQSIKLGFEDICLQLGAHACQREDYSLARQLFKARISAKDDELRLDMI